MKLASELVRRIYTAMPLVGIQIFASFYANYITFVLLVSLLMTLIGWEWFRLLGYSPLAQYGGSAILLLGYVMISYLPIPWIGVLSAFLAVALIAQVLAYTIYPSQRSYSETFLSSVAGIYLILSWRTLLILKSEPNCLGIGLLTIVLTDTLAYLVGGCFGTHALTPTINPNKTWEGCLAGLIGPVIIIALFSKLVDCPFHIRREEMLIILLTSLVAIAGDLFESAIKRQYGVKDSGSSLPGHGGWLDRYDSLVCAIPIFTTSFLYLPRFLNS